jgi:hypothetical protein
MLTILYWTIVIGVPLLIGWSTRRSGTVSTAILAALALVALLIVLRVPEAIATVLIMVVVTGIARDRWHRQWKLSQV